MERWKGHKEGMITKETIVLAEKDVEVLVDKRELLEPSAIKIQDIRAELRNLQLDVVIVDMERKKDFKHHDHHEKRKKANIRIKVIVQGILHKQIFWVGRDNMVHHMQVNEPFSTFVVFTEKDIKRFGSVDPRDFDFDEERIQAQIWDADIEGIVSHLISPNRLQEKVLIGLIIKLEQLAQVEIEAEED